jgi:alpha-glucosidase
MQWDANRYAGFSTVEPWLPLESVYRQRNVAALAADDRSIYQLHRRLIALRRRHQALQVGSYRPLAAEGDLLAYVRETAGDKILVALNMGAQPVAVNLPTGNTEGRLLFSSFCDRANERVTGRITLRGNEGVVIEL